MLWCHGRTRKHNNVWSVKVVSFPSSLTKKKKKKLKVAIWLFEQSVGSLRKKIFSKLDLVENDAVAVQAVNTRRFLQPGLKLSFLRGCLSGGHSHPLRL